MVGAATVIADDPRLTCRIEGGRDPIRVIVDGQLRCPPDATVFRQRSAAPTILVTTPENRDRAKGTYGLESESVIAVSARDGQIALADLMRELARRGWSKVLIEGGAHLAGSALAAGVVDRVAFFVAPRIIGNGLPAVEGLLARTVKQGVALTNFSARRVGDDWLLEADVARRARTRRSR
jgi:diaminohydroxyphosphoribosylaminopyrimidine deaminase/5-amino-6-(5-phosphoribosylamino)uracil reductase